LRGRLPNLDGRAGEAFGWPGVADAFFQLRPPIGRACSGSCRSASGRPSIFLKRCSGVWALEGPVRSRSGRPRQGRTSLSKPTLHHRFFAEDVDLT